MSAPAQAAELVDGLELDRARALSGGDTGTTWRVPRRTGGDVLVKRAPRPAMAAVEAAGLRWLADGGMPTPAVLASTEGLLIVDWVATTGASQLAASAFARDLAAVHGARAEAFGVAPDGVTTPGPGWVGAVEVPYHRRDSWPEHYVHDRLLPTAEAAAARGSLDRQDLAAVHRLCDALLADPGPIAGPPLPPARIHGDLWSGNLLWQADRVLLIDPAAVGGHPETDLGMLHLFGAPLLDRIVAEYADTAGLDAGWRRRIPLHQVFPLLIHAVMFGGGYGSRAGSTARAALAAARG